MNHLKMITLTEWGRQPNSEKYYIIQRATGKKCSTICRTTKMLGQKRMEQKGKVMPGFQDDKNK